MNKQPNQPATFKRSVWLGVLVGWLAQMALKLILPMLVFVGLNVASVATGGEALYVLVHTPYLRPHHDWRRMGAETVRWFPIQTTYGS